MNMRTLVKVTVPVEAGNNAFKDGLLQKTIAGFTETYKPEACYFYPENGKRAMFAVIDLKDPTYITAIAEPFFLNLNASVEFTPVMNSEDLKAGLAKTQKNF